MTRRNSTVANDPRPQDNDRDPQDIDAFRYSLIRRMNNVRHEWRSCNEPACRRARACVAESLACSAGPSTTTPEQQQRAMAELHRALRQRLPQYERELPSEASAPAPKNRTRRQPAARSTRC